MTCDSIRMLDKQGTNDEMYLSAGNISLQNGANYVSFSPDHIYSSSNGGISIYYKDIATVKQIPTTTSKLTNDSNFITSDALNGYATENWVEQKGYLTEHQPLTNYYTKEETYSKAEVDSLIPDTSRFITEVPAEYVTETELNAKGYLTEHQSLTNYYTKAETTQAIQDALNAIGVAEGGAY